MSDQSNRAKAIFLAAIEEHVPEQWAAFLEQACAGDVLLRAEVEKLLRHDQKGIFPRDAAAEPCSLLAMRPSAKAPAP